MTTVTDTRAAAHAAAAAPTAHLTFPHLLRSEGIKIASLRSTWWSLAIAAVLTVGIALMIAAASSSFGPEFPSVSALISPTQFTMLVAGILGAIAITGEYSTGMIRSTLTAAPRRGAVLAAKATVVALLMALAMIVTFAVAVAATAPVLGDRAIDWSDPSLSIVPLAYDVLAMVSFALIGLGWGFVIRNGAGAIAATVGLLFVLPIVVSMFTMAGDAWRWVVDLGQYLPMSAASTLTTPGSEDTLGALVALLAWPAAALLGGWAVLSGRDA